MTWSFDIENVAGIRSGTATLKPGVNAIRASNWQGKSSFIHAIKTAMGTDQPLTEGEPHGYVQLQTSKDVIAVEMERSDGRIIQDGPPFLEEDYARRCAELFAFLDESNEIRHAVRTGENLESVLTSPLKLENINEQIADLKREREQIESELERATTARNRIVALEQKIEETEEELDDLRSKREKLESGAGDRKDVDSLRTELSDARSEKAQVNDLIKRTENMIDRTKSKLNECYEELEDIEIPQDGELESEIAIARDELSDLERDKELLESLYSVNSRILEEDRHELLTTVDHGLLEDSYSCWVCGNETTKDTIEEQFESIREEIESLSAEVKRRRERVDELQERRDKHRQAKRRKQDLQQEVRNLEDTLADREESLASALERREILTERIEQLETQVDESDDKLTSLESEIKYYDTQLNEFQDELKECRNKADQREMLEEERKDLTNEIEQLRNRKDRIRRETRDAFDEAISQVVTLFETGFESARLTGNFDLVVARDGREVSLDALSEGELELLGIVVALAGYEAYDVDEIVPVMLLDGLGGLADENLNMLVEYLKDRTEYLVLTAYPENTSIDGWEIDPNEWSVVSNRDAKAA